MIWLPLWRLNDKSHPQKDLHQFLAGDIRRQLHWGLLVVSSKYSLRASVGTGSPEAIQSSMYRSAASRIFLMTSSRVSPWDTQPGSAGTVATYPPSASRQV